MKEDSWYFVCSYASMFDATQGHLVPRTITLFGRWRQQREGKCCKWGIGNGHVCDFKDEMWSLIRKLKWMVPWFSILKWKARNPHARILNMRGTIFLGFSVVLLFLLVADILVLTRRRRLWSFGSLLVLLFLLLFFCRLYLFFVGQFTQTIWSLLRFVVTFWRQKGLFRWD